MTKCFSLWLDKSDGDKALTCAANRPTLCTFPSSFAWSQGELLLRSILLVYKGSLSSRDTPKAGSFFVHFFDALPCTQFPKNWVLEENYLSFATTKQSFQLLNWVFLNVPVFYEAKCPCSMQGISENLSFEEILLWVWAKNGWVTVNIWVFFELSFASSGQKKSLDTGSFFLLIYH